MITRTCGSYFFILCRVNSRCSRLPTTGCFVFPTELLRFVQLLQAAFLRISVISDYLPTLSFLSVWLLQKLLRILFASRLRKRAFRFCFKDTQPDSAIRKTEVFFSASSCPFGLAAYLAGLPLFPPLRKFPLAFLSIGLAIVSDTKMTRRPAGLLQALTGVWYPEGFVIFVT